MFRVFPVPIFQDNYVWVIQTYRDCILVDPGYAEPVLYALNQRGLTPTALLITHKHWDHISGIQAIVDRYPIPVYGPQCLGIQQITHPVTEARDIQFQSIDATVLACPGHTVEHLAYYFSHQNALFSGDTLFSAGCGRIFDGTVEELYRSLCNLKALPADTCIYATHEYTLGNLAFAQAVEPNNAEIERYRIKCQRLRQRSTPTLPTVIGIEQKINPFLRVHLDIVRRAAEAFAGKPLNNELEVFRVLRLWKDTF